MHEPYAVAKAIGRAHTRTCPRCRDGDELAHSALLRIMVWCPQLLKYQPPLRGEAKALLITAIRQGVWMACKTLHRDVFRVNDAIRFYAEVQASNQQASDYREAILAEYNGIDTTGFSDLDRALLNLLSAPDGYYKWAVAQYRKERGLSKSQRVINRARCPTIGAVAQYLGVSTYKVKVSRDKIQRALKSSVWRCSNVDGESVRPTESVPPVRKDNRVVTYVRRKPSRR